MTDAYIDDATAELKRRGVTGELSAKDLRALHKYCNQGKTAVEAGAHLAMNIIRAG